METMKTFSGTKEAYENEFKGKMKEAIDVALEIRKFEIDLYWKRAAYYWTFIAATFAAYFVLNKIEPKEYVQLFVISCVGFTLSVAWYLANRGSKFWINNWETHVDYLEDEKYGPIYKRVAGANRFKFIKLLTAYPYSVAKINQVVNLYITAVWLFFAVYSLSMKFNWYEPFANFNFYVVGGSTLLTIYFLICQTKTNFEGRKSMDFTQRLLPSEKNDINT